jgi:N12 class adenine-specific DNA methylase/phage gp29-like protein
LLPGFFRFYAGHTMADNNGHQLASFLKNVNLPRDMEIGVRGDDGQINWVAPNMGKYPLSHISTFQAVVTTAARTYREADEAIRASLDNARYMRNDCGIMECLESRQRCTALLNWHIEPEDDRSQEQKDLAAEMTRIMSAIPRFTEYRRVLLEALWFGKHGIQHRYGWQQIAGKWRVLPTRRHHLDVGWQPIHGDKIVFRFDDGNLPPGAYEGQMGIRVGMGHWGQGDLVKQRWKVEATERGMAYFISEAEAKLIAVHRHMIEDSAFEDVRSAAFLNGVGIRSRIYWEWVQKQESLAFLMEYLERSAGGIELWHFPTGNAKAKEEVKTAATERLSNSRNVTLVPIPPGEEGSQYGVQIIEPGMAGIDCLKELLEKYFGHRMKRYILGQTLTSEADATGLGSGVADAHMDTLHQIIKYDATNLEETITEHSLRQMQGWNFPKSRHIRLRFVIDTEDDNAEEKLQAYESAYRMGLKLKSKDVYDIIGASMPGPTDEVLQQQQGGPPGMGGAGGNPFGGGDPGNDTPRGSGPDGGGGGDQPSSPGDNGDGGQLADDAPNAPSVSTSDPMSRASRSLYSKSGEWTAEDEQLHPRGEGGKFAKKGEGGVAVKTQKFGDRWYAMADLPSGGLVTRSHEHEHEARRLAHEDVWAQGHAVEADEPPSKPAEASKPRVKVDLQKFGEWWYAMADLPGGGLVSRQDMDRSKAHKLASEDIRSRGHEPEDLKSEQETSEKTDGPHEGDTNAEGLVFHNGRWHRPETEELKDEHKRAAEPELLADHGGEPDRTAGSGIDRSAAPQSSPVAPGNTGGTSPPGGLGRIPESAGGRSADRDEGPDRIGDRTGDSEGAGPARPADDVERRGSATGLGTGGGDVGPVERNRTPVAESLNEKPHAQNPTDAAAGNWHYHDRSHIEGGVKTKFHNNLEAIQTLRQIAEEGRSTATPAEQEVISKFSGWGQMPGLFNEYWSNDLREVGMDYSTWLSERDKWTEERKLLKPLMSDDEWDAARRATLNSHFTHPDIVDAHWEMARRLGFKGGRFLEPSAGIGFYLGQMPPELAGKTRVSAVELDRTTGDLLKKLYPDAHVEVRGFQDFAAPDGFYDLVASNVPFGAYGVHDPRYNKHQANIHDYFFLKSADLAKPGGLVMHVTSTGTMDKPDDSVRRELAKTCDLVAAYRFPAGTHKENAGTEVVTDMLILRRRHPGEAPVTVDHTPSEAEAAEPGFTGTTTDSLGRVYHWVDGKRVPGPDWFSIKEVPDPDGGQPIPVNAYFADHPENILGRLDRSGTMYRGDSVNVSQTDDFQQRLADAIHRLPEGVVSTGSKPNPDEPEKREAGEGVKDGGFVIRDGKLFRRDGGAEIEQHVNAQSLERITGQLAIRDARSQVIEAELADQSSDEARAELNKLYAAYTKKYGALSTKQNRDVLKGDPDAPNLLALEKWDATQKTATKADIFTKATVRPHKAIDKAESVAEGVGISLHETGGVDIARISALTGKPKEVVERELAEHGLAFEDPGKGWLPADQYLSGNVRKKLVMAKAAAAADPRYKANVEALERVQPEDIDYQDIDVRLGAPWVPPDDIRRFAAEITGIYPDSFRCEYIPSTGQWQFGVTSSRSRGFASVEAMGTQRKEFDELMDAILNGKAPVVFDTDPDGKRHVNEAETKAAQEKVNENKDKFREWVWAEDDRRDRLHRYYNDNFNNVVPMKYNGAHQTFPGMNPNFKMRDIQKNFVWQVVTTGRGLAAHEVGTGKTASMIAAAMELRRLGLAKKPCIAGLKANIEQMTKEARELYPGARILSTADMFDAANRKKTIAQIATGDYDLILMTHDHMDLLPMKSATVQRYIENELEDLRAAKHQAWLDNPNKNNRIVKALEDAQAKLEAKLRDAIDAENKDDAVTWEETGIDQLFVDEAHKYKSLPVYTHGDKVKGVPSTRSDRATNMLMRTQWLMEKNGNRGVVFATGTPVGNTMVELYNMQRYLQPDELKERGVLNFDAWANTFGEKDTRVEATVTGDFAPVTRFAKFTNIPELMHISSQVMDVERADTLRNPDGSPVIVRPKRQDHIVSTPLNDQTRRMMADLKSRADSLRGQRIVKGGDNMAVVCSDGRKGSVDMRLLYKDAEDDTTSKANQCVNKVLSLHKERPGVTQLIFSNVGVHPSEQTGFHLYGDIINKLVAGGIPREKIADFSQLEGAKKDAAQEAMRRGDIVVGIGSTEKLGTGVNVQHRVAAMHHLDVPWMPSEIEQRDGRGFRHGNRNDPSKPAHEQKVDIYRYVSEGSLDTFMWQLVGNKAHFINQVINGKSKARSVSDDDTETLSPEQLMAVASGDPRILQKVQLESDVRDLETGHTRHQRDQSKLADRQKQLEHAIPEKTRQIERHAQDLKHAASFKDKEYGITIGGKAYAERPDAGKALEAEIKRINDLPYYERKDEDLLGEYNGFKLKAGRASRWSDETDHVELIGPSGETYLARPTLASVEAVIRGISQKHKVTSDELSQLRKDLESVKSQIGAPYKRAAYYAEKKKALESLLAELQPANASESAEFARYSRLRFDGVNLISQIAALVVDRLSGGRSSTEQEDEIQFRDSPA